MWASYSSERYELKLDAALLKLVFLATREMKTCIIIVLVFRCCNVLCSNKISESLLHEMDNTNSMREFFNNFVEGGYRKFKFNPSDNRGRFAGETIEEAAVGGCQLVDAMIEVPPANNSLLFSHPECIKVKRCVGCCASTATFCEPTRKRNRFYRVSRFRYNRRSEQLQLVRDEAFKVEEHVNCRCNCKTKPRDCSEDQVFDERSCGCICKNTREIALCRAAHKIWDDRKCHCVCKELRDCPLGYIFSPVACRCRYNLRFG